jgi:DUF1680 family protein
MKRRFSPVSFAAVDLRGTFWRERIETVRARTIPAQLRQLQASGLIEPKPNQERHKTDLQKVRDAEAGRWLEAASYALASKPDPKLADQVNAIADALAAAQLPDGYLNTWFIANAEHERWTNLRDNDELYAAAHLIEAGVAHFQATGERRLIDPVLKYVDHIAETFGHGEDKKSGYGGRQGIELALSRLYRVTRDEKHLDLAAYFIDERGRHPHYFDMEAVTRGDETEHFVGRTYEEHQAHRRVRLQDKAVGNAARAVNMYAAMAELAGERGDASLKRACELLWEDVTTRHMYVTGAIGASRRNEGFGAPYELPNTEAHAETSAAIGMAQWAKRMLTLELDRRYADVMELALYNAALAGLSFDGTHFFRENPLASEGGQRRWEWHPCPEAATDIARTIASVGGFFYATAEEGLAVHLYGGGSTIANVGGRAIGLTETSTYPWDGTVSIVLDPEQPTEFTVWLRIPGWAEGATARINGVGTDVAGNLERGYLALRRLWHPGDTVVLHFPMPVTRVKAHPSVLAAAGRTALKRGPLVYCLEEADNPGATPDGLLLPPGARMTTSVRDDLFGGIVTVSGVGTMSRTDWAHDLYGPEAGGRPTTLTAIPYYLWGNRDEGKMLVWVRES